MTKRRKDITVSTEKEAATLRTMVALYCRGNHDAARGGLCPECAELVAYSLDRIQNCPRKDTKDFCSNCSVHCFQPERREQIRTVMRYSGPRLLLHDPMTAIRHLISSRRHKGT